MVLNTHFTVTSLIFGDDVKNFTKNSVHFKRHLAGKKRIDLRKYMMMLMMREINSRYKMIEANIKTIYHEPVHILMIFFERAKSRGR